MYVLLPPEINEFIVLLLYIAVLRISVVTDVPAVSGAMLILTVVEDVP